MITYVAEGVLEDYTAGLVVITAENLEEAHKIIEKEFYERSQKEIKNALRVMEDSSVVYVYGGG